jgi:hypothetical protein
MGKARRGMRVDGRDRWPASSGTKAAVGGEAMLRRAEGGCGRARRRQDEGRTENDYRPTLAEGWARRVETSMKSICIWCIGAVKRTRTSTPVKELAPQASASTSSAMTALFRFKPAGAKRRRSSNKSPPRRQARGRAGRSLMQLALAQTNGRGRRPRWQGAPPLVTMAHRAGAHSRGPGRGRAGPRRVRTGRVHRDCNNHPLHNRPLRRWL